MSDEGWIRAAAIEDLTEGKGARVTVGDATVLVVRAGDRVFAIGNRCTHQGAPLDRGRVTVSGSIATVTCPAHGSVFGLVDGTVMRGPATKPIEAYETRIVDATVEVRPAGLGRI
jgi:nitrite reductase/ring-hydroxylating ferredoxin subunit